MVKRHVQDGQRLVDLELWLENGKGEKTTLGAATVELTARGWKSSGSVDFLPHPKGGGIWVLGYA